MSTGGLSCSVALNGYSVFASRSSFFRKNPSPSAPSRLNPLTKFHLVGVLRPFLKIVDGGTWTPTDFSTRPSNVHVYHSATPTYFLRFLFNFHLFGLCDGSYLKGNPLRKQYLTVFLRQSATPTYFLRFLFNFHLFGLCDGSYLKGNPLRKQYLTAFLRQSATPTRLIYYILIFLFLQNLITNHLIFQIILPKNFHFF